MSTSADLSTRRPMWTHGIMRRFAAPASEHRVADSTQAPRTAPVGAPISKVEQSAAQPAAPQRVTRLTASAPTDRPATRTRRNIPNSPGINRCDALIACSAEVEVLGACGGRERRGWRPCSPHARGLTGLHPRPLPETRGAPRLARRSAMGRAKRVSPTGTTARSCDWNGPGGDTGRVNLTASPRGLDDDPVAPRRGAR